MKPNSTQTISRLVCTIRATLNGMAGNRKSPMTYWVAMTRPKRICPTNRIMANTKYGRATFCDWNFKCGFRMLMDQPSLFGGQLKVSICEVHLRDRKSVVEGKE